MAYPTAAELRAAVPALESAAKFPDATLNDLVAEFAGIAERYRGVAFIPRTETAETHFMHRDAMQLQLGRVFIRTIDTLTINGDSIASTAYFLDTVVGIVIAPFVRNTTIVVTYEHGLDDLPPGALRACREYVRACALTDRSGVARDVIAQSFADGGYTKFSTADWDAGRPTGWLEVDRLLNALPDYRANCG